MLAQHRHDHLDRRGQQAGDPRPAGGNVLEPRRAEVDGRPAGGQLRADPLQPLQRLAEVHRCLGHRPVVVQRNDQRQLQRAALGGEQQCPQLVHPGAEPVHQLACRLGPRHRPPNRLRSATNPCTAEADHRTNFNATEPRRSVDSRPAPPKMCARAGQKTTDSRWNWIFFINVPIGVLAVLAARMFINETRDSSHEQRLHVPGSRPRESGCSR